ncbi:MAG: trimethylamine methyltransferase family protein [Thermoplasmatota archaeon]|nr:trimethylamine methyltransferase family protein [Candidatus Thermoplasmatota archaeon]MBU1914939.1 trimethylamine methyltransferase family protein [Candidatus Thermoplasmatota archaeon]
MDAISFETIKDACLGGNFLGTRHTITRFRNEAISTIDRDAVLAGEPATGSPSDLIKIARREARNILSEPRSPVASPEEIEKMNAFIKKLDQAG